MQVWNVLRAARWKRRTQKIAKKSPSGHHRTTLSGYIFATKALIGNRTKPFKQQCLPHMSAQYHNMVNFGPVAAEICWRVWVTPENSNGFCVLEALLHGTLVVSVSQTLRRWTEGATYIRQGGHHVGHWSTFLVFCMDCCLIEINDDDTMMTIQEKATSLQQVADKILATNINKM